jgi:hypothetical protein
VSAPVRRPSAWQKLGLSLALLVFCAAPTPGDIGGCGQRPDLLDPGAFFASKKLVDCSRCEDCGLATDSCLRACDEDSPTATAFPADCFPLVHDGEVCLRALRHASCDDYAGYVDDAAPSAPSECNFCPPEKGP